MAEHPAGHLVLKWLIEQDLTLAEAGKEGKHTHSNSTVCNRTLKYHLMVTKHGFWCFWHVRLIYFTFLKIYKITSNHFRVDFLLYGQLFHFTLSKSRCNNHSSTNKHTECFSLTWALFMLLETFEFYLLFHTPKKTKQKHLANYTTHFMSKYIILNFKMNQPHICQLVNFSPFFCILLMSPSSLCPL